MPNYMVLALPHDAPDDESGDMDAWMKWFADCGDAMVDPGSPFGDRRSLGNADTSGAMGYMVIQADDMDGAVKLAEASPASGALEVLEILPMPKP